MKKYSKYIWIFLLAAILLLVPVFTPSYYVGLLILILIYGIFAMSLDIVTGYTGLPSLGHAAYFGVSAYTVGILDLKVLHNFPVQLASGLAVAVFVAAIFGLLALRTKGISFLMITLALSMLLWGLASKWTSLTGSDDGLAGISRPELGPWNLETPTSYYYFVLIIFGIAVAILYFIVRPPLGLTMLGIRENETRMDCLGFDTWRHKYTSFLISGVFGGLAGILAVYYYRYVGPSDLSVLTSAKVLLMMILGGPGTLFGPVLGAGIIILLENIISTYTDRWLLILGVIYVAAILFAPQGIYGPLKRFVKRLEVS